jgi:polyisoprenoid-binding protein YceI
MKRLRLFLACVVVLGSTLVVSAQTYVFELDPQQSKVSFTLDGNLHTVHGSFQVKSGAVRIDASTSTASGLVVVDATSGDSGSKGRDRKMNKDILESGKYPEITFAPHHIAGLVPQGGKTQVTIAGDLTIHGQPHEVSITVPVEVRAGQAVADLVFIVPYVQWGMKNPSAFILRVSDKVEIEVHAVGRMEPATSGGHH